METTIQTTYKLARTMASIKILVCPGGSFTMNSVYMNEGTGQLILSANWLDVSCSAVGYFCNIWCLSIAHPYSEHFGGSGPADVPKVINNVLRLIYTVENQHYPPVNLFHYCDVELAKEFFYKYGDRMTSVNDFIPYLVAKYWEEQNKTIK